MFVVRLIYVRIELAYFSELGAPPAAAECLRGWTRRVWGPVCIGWRGQVAWGWALHASHGLCCATAAASSVVATPVRRHCRPPPPAVFYWSSLRFSTSLLVFSLLSLPLYQMFFVWLWCGVGRGRGVA